MFQVFLKGGTHLTSYEESMALLQKSIENIHNIKDWQQLTHAIVMNGLRLSKCQKGMFLLYDQSLKKMLLQANIGLNEHEIKRGMAVTQSTFIRFYPQKRTFFFQKGFHYFPIYTQNEFTGALVLYSPGEKLLPSDVLNLVRFYMQSVPIVLENSRLYLMIRRKSISLTYMNQLHHLIRHTSFQEVLAETVEKIGELLNSEMAGIMLYDPEKNELALQKPAFGLWDESLINEYRVKLSEKSNATNVFLTGIPSNTTDARTDERYNQFFVNLFKARSIITVPLVVDDKRIGVVHAINKKEGVFTQDDLHLLEDIAAQLGTILDAALELRQKGTGDYKKNKIERYLEKQLIEQLITGKKENLEEVQNILNTLSISIGPRHCFMVIGSFQGETWDKERLGQNKNRLLSTILRYFPQAITTYKSGKKILLLSHEKIDQILQLAPRLQKELTLLLDKRPAQQQAKIYIGIGESVTTFEQSAISYHQANQILRVLPQIEHLGPVGYYPHCGSWALLCSLSTQKELVSSFINSYLRQINQLRDAEEMKKTLETYLKHNGNLKQTAKALFIHQNTLKYRLEKIEDLTGFNLADSELRLNLSLALRLEKLFAATAS